MPEDVRGIDDGEPRVQVAHGIACVSLVLWPSRLGGPGAAIVLSPPAARRLAATLIEQAGYAEEVRADD